MTAKLSRPKGGGVDPAIVRGKPRTLTWGDLASRLKGRRPSRDDAEREVSRGRSSGEQRRQGWLTRLPGAGRRSETRRAERRESETTVSLEDARRQKSAQAELPLEDRGEAPNGERSGEAPTAANGNGRSGNDHLMERVVERGNVEAALKRVRQNKGSPGIDGMTVEELPAVAGERTGRAVRAKLLDGHLPAEAGARAGDSEERTAESESLGFRRCSTGSSSRASCRCCSRAFDPTFSRTQLRLPAWDAARTMRCARRSATSRKDGEWVVDVDLEKFFDRVNHDVLMGRLAKRIGDKRMLGLIRRYLEAGIMANGVVVERHEGTPQGGPLSPLLANVLLDEVDKELERRGHAFVRYADDCNVYVRSATGGGARDRRAEEAASRNSGSESTRRRARWPTVRTGNSSATASG